jgi:hypothetical protein
MNIRKTALPRAIAVVLLVSFFFVLVNTICNGHFHQLANGTLIYHAHPYDNSGENTSAARHQHSRFELFHYDLLTILLELGLFFIIVMFVTVSQTRCAVVPSICYPSNIFPLIPPLRAPPEYSSNNPERV